MLAGAGGAETGNIGDSIHQEQDQEGFGLPKGNAVHGNAWSDAQLRNARERLADFEAEAALERAEYAVEMAMRRANAPSAGVAAVAELVEALGAATAAGADGALVRSARNLVARKGSAQQVEIVKLYDRLDRFKRMAAMSSAAVLSRRGRESGAAVRSRRQSSDVTVRRDMCVAVARPLRDLILV